MVYDVAEIFSTVQNKFNLHMGDFPPVQQFQDVMRGMDITKLVKLKLPLVDELDIVLDREIPRLMEALPGVAEHPDDAEGAGVLTAALSRGLRIVKHGKIL